MEHHPNSNGHLELVDGLVGKAIALNWHLGTGDWVQGKYTFPSPMDLSDPADIFGLSLCGDGTVNNANTISIMFADTQGVFFGYTWENISHIDRWMINLAIPKKQLSHFFNIPPSNLTQIDWSQIDRFFFVVKRPPGQGGTGRLTIDHIQYDKAAAWPRQTIFETVTAAPIVASRALGYLLSQQDPTTGLLVSWKDEEVIVPPAKAWLYDMALALIVFTREGQWVNRSPTNDAARAADKLSDFIIGEQHPYGHWPRGWNPRDGTVLVDDLWVGDQAWWVMALEGYGRAAMNPHARLSAARGAEWLSARIDPSGRVLNADGTVVNTEGHVDVWWAMLATGRPINVEKIKAYLLNDAVWDSELRYWWRGPNDPVIALDAAGTWLSEFARHPLVNEAEKGLASLSFLRRTLVTTNDSGALTGLDGMGPVSVWNEGTAQYVSAGGEQAQVFLDETLIPQQRSDGSMPGSPDEWLSDFGWLTEWSGVAPTAWLYFAVTELPFLVEQITAEPSLTLHQDPADGATGFKVDITRVFDPASTNDVASLVAEYEAKLTYDGACLNVLAVRDLDFTTALVDIDDNTGIATFSGNTAGRKAAPADLAHALTRLVGSNQVSCDVALDLTSLTEDGGNAISVPTTLTHNLLRGDARADGEVSIADALFIAQYLVGSRPACTAIVDTTCLHSVNAASVRQDGAFDKKTIADALFIAQYLVGLRDEFYDLKAPVTWMHGINMPWDSYGTDFGMNSWGYRGVASQGPSGWRRETRENNGGAKLLFWAGQNDCGIDPSLGVEVDLNGQLSNAIVYFQADDLPEKAIGEFLDLSGQTITVEVCFPPGSAGPSSTPNGVVVFVQWGENWEWAQSTWMNISPGRHALTFTPDDLPFVDSTKIRTVGVKMSTNGLVSPSYSLQGNFYLDNVRATSAPEIQFTFSSPDTRTETEMKDIAALNINALRWWVFADGRAGLEFNGDGTVSGLNDEFHRDFAEALRLARSSDIDLVPVLFDFLFGAERQIVDGVQIYGRSDLINDPAKRKSLLDNAISVIFEEYGQAPEIAGWDLMNEPEWLLTESPQFEISEGNRPPEIMAGGVIDPDTMKTFFSEIINLYHQKGVGQQWFTVGSASPQWVTLWQDLDLDIAQFHLWNGPGQIDDGLEFDFEPPVKGVPNILGEFSTNPDIQLHNVCEYLTRARALGYSGAWPWAYRAKDNASLPRLGEEGRECMKRFPNVHP